MSTALRPTVLIGLALICWLDVAAAQDLHPSRRPSPMGMARITLDDTYVRVVYSRPYQRGRENIFGTEESEALVPYGKIWRTGANEGTEITITGEASGMSGSASSYVPARPTTWASGRLRASTSPACRSALGGHNRSHPGSRFFPHGRSFRVCRSR